MNGDEAHTPPGGTGEVDAAFAPVSRRVATIISLVYQYALIVLVIVRGVLLPPLYYKLIDLHVLGSWIAATNVAGWIMVSEGGAWLLLRQQTAQEFGRADRAALNEAIGTGLLILFVLCGFIAGVGLLVAPFAPSWFGIGGETADRFSLAFAIMMCGLALSLISCGPRAVQQGFQRQSGVNLANVLSEIASLAATVVLLYRGYGVMAIALGVLLREVIQTLINWPLMLTSLRTMNLRPVVSRRQFNATLPLMSWTFLSNIGVSLRTSVDAFVVAMALGPPMVVVTEYSKRAWEIVALILNRASNAFTPGLAHLYGSGDVARFREICTKLVAVLGAAMAVLIGGVWAFNQPFVFVWLGADSYVGRAYDLMWGAATVLTVAALLFNDVLFAAGDVRGTAAVQIAQTVLRIVLLIATIVWLGPIAIPLTIIAGTLLGGLHYLLSRWKKRLAMTPRELAGQFRPMFIGVAVAGGLALLWQMTPLPVGWLALGIHAALFSIAALLALFAVEPTMRNLARSAISTVARRIGRPPGGAI